MVRLKAIREDWLMYMYFPSPLFSFGDFCNLVHLFVYLRPFAAKFILPPYISPNSLKPPAFFLLRFLRFLRVNILNSYCYIVERNKHTDWRAGRGSGSQIGGQSFGAVHGLGELPKYVTIQIVKTSFKFSFSVVKIN